MEIEKTNFFEVLDEELYDDWLEEYSTIIFKFKGMGLIKVFDYFGNLNNTTGI